MYSLSISLVAQALCKNHVQLKDNYGYCDKLIFFTPNGITALDASGFFPCIERYIYMYLYIGLKITSPSKKHN